MPDPSAASSSGGQAGLSYSAGALALGAGQGTPAGRPPGRGPPPPRRHRACTAWCTTRARSGSSCASSAASPRALSRHPLGRRQRSLHRTAAPAHAGRRPRPGVLHDSGVAPPLLSTVRSSQQRPRQRQLRLATARQRAAPTPVGLRHPAAAPGPAPRHDRGGHRGVGHGEHLGDEEGVSSGQSIQPGRGRIRPTRQAGATAARVSGGTATRCTEFPLNPPSTRRSGWPGPISSSR